MDTHTHNTRHRDVVKSENTNRTTSERTQRHILPKLIRTIPDQIINSVYTHSLHIVKHRLKLNYLETYQEYCSIQNCYVCNKTI